MTIAVFALGIGTATCTATIFHSAEALVLNMLRHHTPGDFVITSAFREQGWMEAPLQRALATELGGTDGVQSVETERLLSVTFQDQPVLVRTLEPSAETTSDGRWLFVEGTPSAGSAMLAGEGVLVSRNFARLFEVRPGGAINLAGPDGDAELRVLGVVEDFASPVGSVIMTRRALAALSHDDLVTYVYLTARPGADQARVLRNIRDRVGGRYRLRILTIGDFLANAKNLVGQVFHFTRAVTGIVLLIAMVAVLQSLVSGALEHRRILSIMRALGASRRQLRLTFVAQGAALALVGTALGLIAGVGLSLLWIPLHLRYLLGWTIPIEWPWST
ncbi:MAG: ABC transporter permease, partial [Candidatus Rokuibacteriota bacterium]